MKYSTLAALSLCIALGTPVLAQDHSAHEHHTATNTKAATDTSSTAADAWTAGEITRVDARTGKLTIRHEDIRNLDMPAMTMVFALADSANGSSFKAGDKVMFHAQELEGALTITRIQPAS